MLRQMVSSLVVLALVVGVAFAADKAEKKVTGKFASFKDGTLTIKVVAKKGEEPKAVDFKVAADTKAVTLVEDTKKEGTAKDALKDLKEGTVITLTIGEGDKVTNVQIGTAKKSK